MLHKEKKRQKKQYDTRYDHLTELLLNPAHKDKFTIVYCTTVTQVDYLYRKISQDGLEIKACKYTGQMSVEERQKSLKRFCHGYADDSDCCNVMIATKAFGMGIDKDDIELIIHYDIPESIEDYYQEIGRGARGKGRHATCYLLRGSGDDLRSLTDNREFGGTMFHTVKSVLIGGTAGDNLLRPLSSRFSKESKEQIYAAAIYRMAKIYRFCNLYDNKKCHEFIRDYFMEETLDDESLEAFCQYVKIHFGKDMKVPDCHAMLKDNVQNVKELINIIRDVNEIRINNTELANALRLHPEKFAKINGCMVYETKVKKWKKKLKDGSNADENSGRNIKMVLHTEKLPDYLDMCIMDAIYSIEVNRSNRIYVKTIWEILSGNPDVRFSRSDSYIKTTIESRIEALRDMRISIYDEREQFQCEEEIFLPLRDTAEGEKGYRYRDPPPLYRFAEQFGDEILKLPTAMLDCTKASDRTDKGTDAAGDHVVFRYTIANMVLTHYLLHRISIFKCSGRGRYINFSTVYNVCQPYLPDSAKRKPEDLQRKITALMNFWSRMPDYIYAWLYKCKDKETSGAGYNGIVLRLNNKQPEDTETLEFKEMGEKPCGEQNES